jgi:hypothetical protein
MDKELELRRKKAMAKFFEEVEFRPEEIYGLVERCADFGTLNPKTGDVFIRREHKLTTKEQVALVPVVRFLGSQVDEKIDPVVTIEEVAKYVTIDEPVARARLSDFTRGGLLTRMGTGSYSARSLATVKRFIEGLERKYKGKEGS